MKTILQALLLLVVTVANATSKNNDDNFQLVIEGKILSESNVSYEVYRMNADSSYEKIESHKALHWYQVRVDIGESYLVKFKSKSGQIKCLFIKAETNGIYPLDVDFLKKDSAKLVPDKKKQYILTTLTNSQKS